MTIELITNLENHKRRIWSICWSPDGNFLASVGADKYITIWYKKNVNKNVNKNNNLKKSEKKYNEKYGIEFGIYDIIETNHEKSLRHIEFSKDGNFFIVASFDSKCSIYVKHKNNKWKFYKTLEGHEKEVKCASIHPTNKYIVTCGRDKSIWIHAKSKVLAPDNKENKENKENKDSSNENKDDEDDKDNSFQLDEQTNKTVSDSDKNCHKEGKQNDINNAEILNKNELNNNEAFYFNFDAYLTAHTEDIKFVTWCPLSETTFISLSYDNSLKIWNKKNDEWYCIQTINEHKSVIWCAAFNFDGSQFATCSDDKTIRIWESNKKNLYNELKYPFLYRQLIKDENNNSFDFDINEKSNNLKCSYSDKNAKQLLTMYTKNNFLPLYFQYGMFKTVYSYQNKSELETENNNNNTSQKKESIQNNSQNYLHKTTEENQKFTNENKKITNEEKKITNEENKNLTNPSNPNKINTTTYSERNEVAYKETNCSSITNFQNIIFDDWKIKDIIEGYHKRSISYLDWNMFEDLIATSSFDNSLKIFSKNNKTWNLIENVEDAHISDVNCVVWCPQKYQNYYILATTGDDCVVNIWMYKKE